MRFLYYLQLTLEGFTSEEKYDSILDSVNRADSYINNLQKLLHALHSQQTSLQNPQLFRTLTQISNQNRDFMPSTPRAALHHSVAYLSPQPRLKDFGKCAWNTAPDMPATAWAEAPWVLKNANTASSLRIPRRTALPRHKL